MIRFLNIDMRKAFFIIILFISVFVLFTKMTQAGDCLGISKCAEWSLNGTCSNITTRTNVCNGSTEVACYSSEIDCSQFGECTVSDCAWILDPGEPTPTPGGGGGGGGGGFNWFSCPSGQVKSCESPAEALAQNKYACTNRAYCDNYFSPELIGGACAYQDNGDPYKWDCQWNCSCCPTGSYRSCTQGSQYTVDVRIELPLDEAGIAAKVSCAQWHGHDDIFVSNDCLPIGQNCNNHDGQWQDWQLTCIHNDCGCATPPTPTPPAPKKSARTSKPRGTIFAAAT